MSSILHNDKEMNFKCENIIYSVSETVYPVSQINLPCVMLLLGNEKNHKDPKIICSLFYIKLLLKISNLRVKHQKRTLMCTRLSISFHSYTVLSVKHVHEIHLYSRKEDICGKYNFKIYFSSSIAKLSTLIFKIGLNVSIIFANMGM